MRTLLASLSLAFAIQCQAESSWSSYYKTNRYDFTISDAELAKTPIWNESDDHPPLAARKALRLARARLAALVSDSNAWKLDALSLREVGNGHWIYLAVFDLIPPGGLEGLPSRIMIPVLMTGVAVKPKVSAWPG